MSAVCPSCGVPVVPGYVKCPKCHTALPYGTGRRASAIGAGGTAVPERGFPVVAVVVPVVVVVAIIVVFGAFRGGDDRPPTEPPVTEPAQDMQVPQPAPAPRGAPRPARAQPGPISTAPRVTPASAGADLERALRKQRLWASVEIAGDRIDVRSSSCSDEAMAPMLDAATASLREVGLTELRCLAQSGAVVFTRTL